MNRLTRAGCIQRKQCCFTNCLILVHQELFDTSYSQGGQITPLPLGWKRKVITIFDYCASPCCIVHMILRIRHVLPRYNYRAYTQSLLDMQMLRMTVAGTCLKGGTFAQAAWVASSMKPCKNPSSSSSSSSDDASSPLDKSASSSRKTAMRLCSTKHVHRIVKHCFRLTQRVHVQDQSWLMTANFPGAGRWGRHILSIADF